MMKYLKTIIVCVNFGSPFNAVKVPFWSPIFSKFGLLWVPFLEPWGPLEIGEQCYFTVLGQKKQTLVISFKKIIA